MTTKCRVIVDTSKTLAYGHLIEILPNIQLFILHLIQDARGIAFSCQSPIILPETGKPMSDKGAWKSSALWLSWNQVIELLWNNPKRGDRYLRMRYEDFILNPQHNLALITSHVKEYIHLRKVINNRVEISQTHTMSCHPNRFEHG